MEILLDDYSFEYEFFNVAREFFPVTIDDCSVIKIAYEQIENKLKIKIDINADKGHKFFENLYELTKLESVRNRCRLGLYDALSQYFDVKLPWGDLTGIRPTKVAYDLMRFGIKKTNISSYLRENYRVSDEKIKLILDIIENQKPLEKKLFFIFS